jgi:glycosyltransferase involved in cell wall biosynthesis
MTATIVICTHNRSALLRETLEALALCERPGPVDVVVVDNRSTDDTAAVVVALAREYPMPLRVAREERPGKSAALNTGIALAGGDVIVFTDDDAVPDRRWLVELDAAFRATGCDWTFGRVVPKWQSAPPAWFGPELNGMFALLDFGDEPFAVTEPRHAFYGVNCAVRRASLEALGPYRSDLGPQSATGGGGDDMDMFFRALAAGQRIQYVPGAVVAHVIPPVRTSKSFHRQRIFNGRGDVFKVVAAHASSGPQILGIPRYRYRRALADLRGYAAGLVRRNRPAAFYHELRLLGFCCLVQQAVAAACGGGSRPRVAKTPGMDQA